MAVTSSRPTQAPISHPPRGLSLPASAWGCLCCLGSLPLDHSGAETPLPGAMHLLPSPAMGTGSGRSGPGVRIQGTLHVRCIGQSGTANVSLGKLQSVRQTSKQTLPLIPFDSAPDQLSGLLQIRRVEIPAGRLYLLNTYPNCLQPFGTTIRYA